MNDREFIDAVAGRAGVPTGQAANLTRAVLATLAQRISGGQADDIANQLSAELGQHLRRPPGIGNAEAFDLGEFVRRVSQRADVGYDLAAAGVPAVLTTLREAVTGKEFEDVLSQLPREYWEIIEPVTAGRRTGT